MKRLSLLSSAAAALLFTACATSQRDGVFSSPEEAAQQLSAAVNSGSREEILRVFGPEAEPILSTGDEIQDRQARERFTIAMNQGYAIDRKGDVAFIEVGRERWPFPIPLVRSKGKWHFDTASGKDELFRRRIGENELSTLALAHFYVDAQKLYASKDRNGDGVKEFAQRMRSTEGKRDGLYWPPEPDVPQSPLGPVFAKALEEGYRPNPTGPTPYHGYYFRILTAQGPNAGGGEKSYVSRGKMTKGFALIAYPVEWGESGVMTFIVNQDGQVFEKDLGPGTTETAAAIGSFDPDPSWAIVPAG